MAVSKVQLNSTTLIDVSQDTVSESNLLSGYTATGADGTSVSGTIATKSSSDLSVSGSTVTVPAGYYASDVSVTSGMATEDIEDLFKLKTESGSVASFTPVLDTAAISELNVEFEPIQASPKNLYNYTTYYANPSGLSVSLSDSGIFTISGVLWDSWATIIPRIRIEDVLEDGETYTLSCTCEPTNKIRLYVAGREANSNETTYYTDDTHQSVSFTVDKTTYPYYFIGVYSTTLANWGNESQTIVSGFQLEKGSSATSFEPYSISLEGRTGCDIYRTRRNIFNYTSYYANPSGLSVSLSDSGIFTISGVLSENRALITPVIAIQDLLEDGETYTISCTCEPTDKVHLQIHAAEPVNYRGPDYTTDATHQSVSFTVDKTSYRYYSIYVRAGTTTDWGNESQTIVTGFQLEKGSSATSFVPYADTYSFDWESSVGTVYGGTLDAVSGVLTVTDAKIASYNGETLPGTWISNMDTYASGTTPTTGAQVVYKLATPITYQITPQEIDVELGTINLFWSDSGDVEVKYSDVGRAYADFIGRMTEQEIWTAASTGWGGGN